MRRHILGLLAVAGLVAAIGLYFSNLDEFWSGTFAFMCFRVALVLGAVWLALPQVQQMFGKVPPWLIAASAAGILLAMVTKSFFVLVPIVAAFGVLHFVGWLFKPIPKRSRSPRSPSPRKPDRS